MDGWMVRSMNDWKNKTRPSQTATLAIQRHLNGRYLPFFSPPTMIYPSNLSSPLDPLILSVFVFPGADPGSCVQWHMVSLCFQCRVFSPAVLRSPHSVQRCYPVLVVTLPKRHLWAGHSQGEEQEEECQHLCVLSSATFLPPFLLSFLMNFDPLPPFSTHQRWTQYLHFWWDT